MTEYLDIVDFLLFTLEPAGEYSYEKFSKKKILKNVSVFTVQKFCFFSGSDKPIMLFVLLINAFYIYEQEEIHAQLR